MLRTLFTRSIGRTARAFPAARVAAPAPLRLANSFQNLRFYSDVPELTKELVQERIYEILESYSRVTDHAKITTEASFSKDLGLDSLDVAEIVMAIEEEFSIEIPDHEANEIQSVSKAIDYVFSQPDAC